ncbi:septum formation initiator family protein [Maricaulaceae bacterium NA33B04]|nr:septum formation initiator family protein [Maricaulaceae bacterium NA33B04]
MNALKRFIPLGGLMVVIAYLGFHAWTGEQGYRNHLRLSAEIAETRQELAEIRAERIAMEDRVARLDDAGPDAQIDVDYLEERARAVLRLAHPDEIVVTLDAAPQG